MTYCLKQNVQYKPILRSKTKMYDFLEQIYELVIFDNFIHKDLDNLVSAGKRVLCNIDILQRKVSFL